MTQLRDGTPVQAILWDHDGVLVDTEPWFYEATRQVLSPLGIDIPRDDWVRAQAQGRHLEEIVGPERGASLDYRRIRQLRDERYTGFLRAEELALDGVGEVLRDLAGTFRMALEGLDLPAEAAVSIEDSEHGHRSATAAGLRCLVVRNAFTASHTFDGAWKVLASIREVPAVLGT